MPELPIPESFPFPNINTKVSDNDVMLSGRDFKHYLALGVSAQQFISAATAFAGGVNVTDILDLPCGHGRVTRVLRAAFPNASIVVSDIDRDGVDFCAKTFNATPIYSSPDFKKLNLGRKFDVVWVGSLITHLPANKTIELLSCLLRHLKIGGLVIASTHGAFVAGRVQIPWISGLGAYALSYAGTEKMLSEYFGIGYGYSPYPTNETYVPNNDQSEQTYGVSLITREWFEGTLKSLGAEVLIYRAHA